MSITVLSAEQNQERRFCTRQSAARYLDCDPGTFARWVDLLGLSVFYDPQGRPRYLWDEVERMVSKTRPKEFRPREQLIKARAARGTTEIGKLKAEIPEASALP